MLSGREARAYLHRTLAPESQSTPTPLYSSVALSRTASPIARHGPGPRPQSLGHLGRSDRVVGSSCCQSDRTICFLLSGTHHIDREKSKCCDG